MELFFFHYLARGVATMKKILFIILFILIFTSSAQALSWAYSFVVWNGNVYEVTDVKVVENEIGEHIGEVKTKPNDMTGEYRGNASNEFPKGTKYYEIKNVSTDKAIAVEGIENEYIKAIFIHEAPNHILEIVPYLILIVMVTVIIIVLTKRNNSM